MEGQAQIATRAPGRFRPSGWVVFLGLTIAILTLLCATSGAEGLTTYVLVLLILATAGIGGLVGRLVRLPELGRAFAIGGLAKLLVGHAAVWWQVWWEGREAPQLEGVLSSERIFFAFLVLLWLFWMGLTRRSGFWRQSAWAVGLVSGWLTCHMLTRAMEVGKDEPSDVPVMGLAVAVVSFVFWLLGGCCWCVGECWRGLCRWWRNEPAPRVSLYTRGKRYFARPAKPATGLQLQFGLRTLLVAILVVAIPLGWFRAKQLQAVRCRQAMASLARCRLALFLPFGEGDYWLDQSIGNELCNTAILDLEKQDTADSDLALLAEFKRVELVLRGPFDDRDMAYVGAIRQIRSLKLFDSAITDAGLANLSSHTELTRLTLWNVPITDAGLAKLASLNALSVLDLSGTAITDQGLQSLVKLPNLNSLDLSNTGITDQAIESLGSLPHLELVNLTSTQVTPAGIAQLRGLSHARIMATPPKPAP